MVGQCERHGLTSGMNKNWPILNITGHRISLILIGDSSVTRITDFEASIPGFEFQLCHF